MIEQVKLRFCFPGIKMQGYLFKKSEKNKKWKSLYFVLIVDEADTHLCFYDNPKVSYRLFIFCYLYLVGSADSDSQITAPLHLFSCEKRTKLHM